MQIYERGFMSMLLSDAIVPVQDLLTEKKKQVDFGDFIKPVASYYQYKGKLMSMPFNSSTPILFYNKEQFEKAGFAAPADTWAGAREAALRHQAEGRGRVRLVARRRLFLEPDGELQHGERPAVGHQGRTAMTGSTPSSSTTRPGVVGQVTRLQKWVNDGIIQIAGQGLSPEQLFTSGKCATFFASTAAHGSIERDAKIKWSATYLPHEADLTARNSSIGGATLWVMKGHKAEEYDGGRRLPRPSSPAPTCSSGGTR